MGRRIVFVKLASLIAKIFPVVLLASAAIVSTRPAISQTIPNAAFGCPNVDRNLRPGPQRMKELIASAIHFQNIRGKHGFWLCAREALDLVQKLLARDHEQVLLIRFLYAQASYDLGWYSEAEPHYREILEIRLKTLGKFDSKVSDAEYSLANLLVRQGRYAQAEKLHRNILTTLDKNGRHGTSDHATILNNLGVLHLRQARISDGRALIERARSIWENHHGSRDLRMAISFEGLAIAADLNKDFSAAERHIRRAIETLGTAQGQEGARATLNLYLADILVSQGKTSGVPSILQHAAKLHRDSRTLKSDFIEFTLPLDGPAFVFNVNLHKTKAKYYLKTGRYNIALDLLKAARVTQKERLGQGPAHAEMIDTNYLISEIHFLHGGIDQALSTGRMMFEGLKERLLVGSGDGFDPRFRALRRSYRDAFAHYVDVLITAHQRSHGRRDYQADAFEVAQWARVSQAATALDRMAARLGTGNESVSKLVRDRQNTIDQFRRLERALVEEFSAPSGYRSSNYQEELDRLTTRLQSIDVELQANYPTYFSLIVPSVLSVPEMTSLVRDGESLIAPLIGPRGSFIFVVSDGRVSSYRIPATSSGIAQSVNELRHSINDKGIGNFVPPAFNLSEAHKLFRTVIAPVWNIIRAAEHVIVIPDGALETIPLSVLISEAPPQTGDKLKDYARAAWLDEQFAISTLPSLGALKALRDIVSPSQASKQFLGIGNPANLREPPSPGATETRSISSADFNKLRTLHSLPATEDEIRGLAASFGGVPGAEVLLSANATEAHLMELNALKELKEYRVLAFATHTFVSTGISADGYAESGLVLSLPDTPTRADDGFLSSSDIALLDLDAEWVLLSACNTAAGDGSVGSTSLSGLARAFLYAGTRSLLVSHWYVNDASTADLVTQMAERARASSQPLAKSLSDASRAMRKRKGGKYAHPNYWAPFSIVGL